MHGSDGVDVAVNECVGAASLDPDAKVIVPSIANLRVVAGDWCSVDGDWRVVRVGP